MHSKVLRARRCSCSVVAHATMSSARSASTPGCSLSHPFSNEVMSALAHSLQWVSNMRASASSSDCSSALALNVGCAGAVCDCDVV
ncbi:hypothetical protein BAAA27673_03450 [Bifidobacterium animalis subsp. lactis ATCC 27673]|nr:hypothetical protein BAAA27673_03450 [Bifidobacterium animalis subsp. lactis ATCC 27673]